MPVVSFWQWFLCPVPSMLTWVLFPIAVAVSVVAVAAVVMPLPRKVEGG